MAEPPTSPLVCIAWLSAIGIAPAASNVPQDAAKWAATGFLTAETVGGSIDPDTGERAPVLAVHGWWVKPNASTPPWGKAADLIEQVIAACTPGTFASFPRQVTPTPGNYRPAVVRAAWPLTEPLKLYEPDTSRAHFSIDLALSWVELPE